MDVIADPDCRLFTLMAAYAALEVPCSATPGEIRRAHRHVMINDHPDLHPAGSEDHRNAFARMSAINDAYALVRDAPLRLVDIRGGSGLETLWRDHELESAIRRGRADRIVRGIGLAAVFALVAVALSLPLALRLDRAALFGFDRYALVVPSVLGLAAVGLSRWFDRRSQE